MAEQVSIGNTTLYLGDCRDVLPTLGKVDAIITDPPYGVGFLGKVTKHTDSRTGLTYEDTPEHFSQSVIPGVELAISIANRAAIFTGVRRLQEYPRGKDIGGIVCPNGGGRSPWGFGCFHPVIFYGSSPHKARPTATVMYHPGMHVTKENDIGHPCPKPIAFMEWAVEIASKPQETVCDPFMGSGTTGAACINLGRKFIGIEIERKYFDIACQRIDLAQRQGRMFA